MKCEHTHRKTSHSFPEIKVQVCVCVCVCKNMFMYLKCYVCMLVKVTIFYPSWFKVQHRPSYKTLAVQGKHGLGYRALGKPMRSIWLSGLLQSNPSEWLLRVYLHAVKNNPGDGSEPTPFFFERKCTGNSIMWTSDKYTCV